MLILRANLDDLNVITDASADIEVHLSAMIASDATPPVIQPFPNLGPLASITSGTTTMILDTSGITSGHNVNVKHLNLYNNHGSTACTCTVNVADGTNTTILAKAILLAGEYLVLTQGGVWIHYDANGGQYPQVGATATQAEMEAGTSTVTTVSPGRQHFHPSAAKVWCEALVNSTTILASYNMTSLTDTATGAMTFTIATDFSSANWCCVGSRSEDDLTLVYSCTYDAKAAGSVILRSAVEAGSGSDPSAASGNAGWSMVGYGDI